MSYQIHPDNFFSQLPGFLGRFGDLNAPALSAPTGVYLSFNDRYFRPQITGRLFSFFRCFGNDAVRNRNMPEVTLPE